MTDREPWRPGAGGPGLSPVNRELVEQVLRDDAALRVPDPDVELEALQRAILVEDVFGVTLSDEDLDPALLTGPDAVLEVVTRRRRPL